jgi:glucose-6-phosphate 1-dehydrogenase
VERAWEIMDGLVRAWAEGSDRLHPYEAGSWGPSEADGLMSGTGRGWRTL